MEPDEIQQRAATLPQRRPSGPPLVPRKPVENYPRGSEASDHKAVPSKAFPEQDDREEVGADRRTAG